MAPNKYHDLFTAKDTVIVFIDHQPQMTFGVDNIDKATLVNNVSHCGWKEYLKNMVHPDPISNPFHQLCR
jgi:hypothetical protein